MQPAGPLARKTTKQAADAKPLFTLLSSFFAASPNGFKGGRPLPLNCRSMANSGQAPLGMSLMGSPLMSSERPFVGD